MREETQDKVESKLGSKVQGQSRCKEPFQPGSHWRVMAVCPSSHCPALTLPIPHPHPSTVPLGSCEINDVDCTGFEAHEVCSWLRDGGPQHVTACTYSQSPSQRRIRYDE